jgi:DNA-binding response OmpR family regulator
LRILLAEDDPALGPALQSRLRSDGFVVDLVTTCADADEALLATSYRAVLLDRRLPDGDGLEVLAKLQRRSEAPPVLIITALEDVVDRVAGIEAGAEDYLVKPFAYDELRARLLSRLRRPAAAAAPSVTLGRLRYDVARREVWIGSEPLTVPRGELAVLDCLARRAGRVVLREHLEADVYGYDDDVQANALEAQVSRLRKRLADAGAEVALHAVRGVGYILRAQT